MGTAATNKEPNGTQEHHIIRTELNIEKWPIFVPGRAKHKQLTVTNVFQQEITLPDGRKQVGTVKKVPTAYGDLTTEDLVVYYALIMIWDEDGRTRDRIHLSLRRIARILERDWGQNVAESIKTSLYRLRMTSFIWSKSFYDATKNKEESWVSLGKNDPFSILEELHIHETKQDGHATKEVCYFKFHTRIIENLLNNHTRPVILNTILELNSDIGKLLYRHIDRIMAYKTRYERRTKELFEDLGLSGKTYAYRSKRKEKLAGALKELQGVPLTTGTLETTEICETNDKQDFKVIFIKKPRKKQEPQPPEEEQGGQQSFQPPLLPNETLILSFHRQCKRPNHTPTRKECQQAETLLEQYGQETAQYIIDYAVLKAEMTNFDMQYFGAVLQYEQEALAAYARQQERRQRQTAQKDQAQSAEQLDLLSVPNDPEARLQAQFDGLEPEMQAQIREIAEARLASHKNRMKPEVYEDTLLTVIFREMQSMM